MSRVLNQPERCFSDGTYRVVTDTGTAVQVCPDHIGEFLVSMRPQESRMIVYLGMPAISFPRNRCEFIFAEVR